ncbi:formin-like protein 3 isoform X1 [Juglans microcarpa x Juglans regia]|uniref:formin-like protein 3 isoform X1 n=1 Tax=Juglans microcarpa x Juglans regia TaxID=2249226 RepID=UPI001B7E30E4|nr:formin-like protein 3 isoform X1 [Juglans microcarpa x Juglans regia]
MGLRRAGYAVVFVILLCILSIRGSDVKIREIAVTFFSNADSPETDGNMVEKIWIRCRKELIDRKETLKELELSILHEITRDIIPAFSTNENIDRSLRVLPPHVRQTVLDCLRRKSLLFHGPIKGACSENGIINCVEWLFSWPNVPRRYLVSKSSRMKPPSPAPAPIPASTSPRSGLAPYNQVPASTPSPSLGAPVGALEETYFSSDIIDPIAPPPPHKRSPPVHHVVPQKSPKKHDSSQKEKIVLVTATAAGVLAFVALLLLCCLKGSNKKNGAKDGKRDEKPLLMLSMSDFSAGSSQNSVSPGNSSRKDFIFDSGKSPFLINMSLKHGNNDPSPAGAPASEGAEPAPFPPLKLPPGRSAPSPPAPPSTQPTPPAPQPPPPSKVGRPPPAPPKPSGRNRPSYLGPHRQGNNGSSEGCDLDGESEAPKAKLKPFFWDKVLANPDQSMVWHEISSGSFQFNEEMIESLFGYTNIDKNKIERKKESTSLEPTQYIQIIDPKKAQNLSILLRALNVTTEEVLSALQEGNELPVELLQTLLKMAPTTEEELKLRLFSGDLSQLGPAERFLKVLVDFPLAFKRIESLLFMSSVREEVSTVKESLETLEVASKKLKSSRLFLKLLEAVLKTGNRMNDGTYRGGAQAFKLDTLLKLSDVKGTDGKTTLLHFVVQEIIRSEGIRAIRTARASQSTSSMKTDDFAEDSTEESAEHYRNVGLQVVSGLSGELEDVKKAAFIDADSLTATVSKLNQSMKKTKDFLYAEMKSLDHEESEFHRALANFVECMEADISRLLEEEKRIMALVKSAADYFHGKAGKDEGLRLFAIVRDFLRMLDKACKEVRDAGMKTLRTSKKEAPSASSCKEIHQQSSDIRQRLFPAIVERRKDDSSSDDESPSTL